MSYDISYTGIRLKPFTREDTDLNGYEKTNVMKSTERHMYCCSTFCTPHSVSMFVITQREP